MSLNTRRLLDLSVTLDNNPYTDPPPLLPKIDYMDHQQGWPEMAAMFPGLRKEDLPGDESWAAERLQITTHSGTHMDAPWHYASTTDGGKPAFGIDELPLEWCLQPGVKLDFRHMADGHVVTAAQVEAELARIGHELQPLEIVLVNTRAGSLFGQPGYLEAGVGMGREATLYLLERGVRVVGTDAWVGMRHSSSPANASVKRATPRSFGRAIRPGVISAMGRWRSWPIWSSYRRMGFW